MALTPEWQSNKSIIDFSDTETAFAAKTNESLKKSVWLFNLMKYSWLVNIGSFLAMWAVKLRIPFSKLIVKNTIFQQFCAGITLLDTKPVIDNLLEHKVTSMFNPGIEAKEHEAAFNKTMNETIRAIEFAGQNKGIPVVGVKITGMARVKLLEDIQAGKPLKKETRQEYKNILKRVDAICHTAVQRGVKIYFDAEESWLQDTLDHLVMIMIRRYNKKEAIIFNTFQMYRHDRLQFLIDSYNFAKKSQVKLGAKLVRGAYMVKERQRAQKMGYPSPIHPNKMATDDAYNTGLKFCLDNLGTISLCNATHNENSTRLLAEMMAKKGIEPGHPNIIFCQLYGMSDNLTFNLAKAGFNASKYIVYGPIEEVIPFLVRRAQENTSITGEIGRELDMLLKEAKRRNL